MKTIHDPLETVEFKAGFRRSYLVSLTEEGDLRISSSHGLLAVLPKASNAVEIASRKQGHGNRELQTGIV